MTCPHTLFKEDLVICRGLALPAVAYPHRGKVDFASRCFPSETNADCVCRHRGSYPEMVLDELCILIHDGFPKAAHHALVMARDPALHDMRSLTGLHIPLLQHMKVALPSKSWT